jgi:hypothetical protein
VSGDSCTKSAKVVSPSKSAPGPPPMLAMMAGSKVTRSSTVRTSRGSSSITDRVVCWPGRM